MDRYVVDVTQIIIAGTGFCTFLLTLYIAVQAQRIHIKADSLIDKTEILATQTNSLTEKLVVATGAVERAEGVKEGMAQAVANIVGKGSS